MAGTKEIKRRIKSVKNTKKITKAMELVAASKMKRAVSATLASRLYAEYSWEILTSIAKNGDRIMHPLFSDREKEKMTNKTLLILITSNRGLCGAYNAQVIKKTLQLIKQENKNANVSIITVGKKGDVAMRRVGQNVVASFFELPNNLSIRDVTQISKLVINEYILENYDKVLIAYTDFISALTQTPNIKQVLPISKSELKNLVESLGEQKDQMVLQKDQKIDYLHFLAESFLGYNFGVIFHCAENSKNDLKALLVSKNPIHPTVLELIISLLLFTLKVCRLMSYLKAHILAPNSSQEPLKCSLSSDSLSSNNCQSIQENSILVLCRICEEYVPLDLLEQHSNSCAIMFHEQSNILTTDERIGKLQKSIISKALSHPWPGEASFSTNASLPILHVGFILESVTKVDSLDALSVYCEALSMISISPDISPHSEFLSRARTLVTDKKEAHIRYSEANSARGYTLTEPTSKSTNDVKISDFELVERISSGAYARVYYAIKKNTRDRYAIKAVSKSTLQNKNQINMLLTEKDLLLSFSNPYVVKFYFSFTGFHN
ncbi:MAG: AGC family protein kinase, partial [Candidatus Nomurabacteria bacterium GW2011_GWE2_40_10]